MRVIPTMPSYSTANTKTIKQNNPYIAFGEMSFDYDPADPDGTRAFKSSIKKVENLADKHFELTGKKKTLLETQNLLIAAREIVKDGWDVGTGKFYEMQHCLNCRQEFYSKAINTILNPPPKEPNFIKRLFGIR